MVSKKQNPKSEALNLKQTPNKNQNIEIRNSERVTRYQTLKTATCACFEIFVF
jgi:hypothetical protein